MDKINGLSGVVNFIARQFADNNSNATNPGNVFRGISDSFVSSSVGKLLAQRYSPLIHVDQAAPALANLFKQAP